MFSMQCTRSHTPWYIYMYVCMRVCVYACMRICVYVCMCVCVYVFMCVCVYVCMYACMYACMYVCIYECMYIYVCVYVDLASKRSERDTYRANTIENRGCLFIGE